MTDSCQLKLVICVIKTSLHEHCIKTVIDFLLVCIVHLELSGVLLRYVSFYRARLCAVYAVVVCLCVCLSAKRRITQIMPHDRGFKRDDL